MKKRILSLSLLTIGLSMFSSCSVIRQGIAFFRTPDTFTHLSENVQIENKSDEQFGREISTVVPQLIDSIEIKFLHKFISPPQVYLCNSNKSFCKYSGAKFPGPRARVNKGVFISPRLNGSTDWKEIIYHELSHVVLFQYSGIFHYIKVPVWFHEGLATYISNGGGSGDVTDSAAILEILKGNHFYPVANENILFPKSFSNDKISAWMEYRQAMLFVKFMREGREKKFENLLNALFRKKSFSKSIETSYDMKVPELWNKFLGKLRRNKDLGRGL
jgi:hypothetical protein